MLSAWKIEHRGICGIALLGLASFASDAIAQTTAQQDPSEVSALDHFLVEGGAIAYFLVCLSFVTIGLIIDHFFHIRAGALMPDQLKITLVNLMQDKKYKEVLGTVASDQSLLGGVVHAGLSQANNGLPAMERAMEEVMESRAASLFRRIEYLNIIGNVSPMIGLFGTVFGMIDVFSAIVSKGGSPDPATLAQGISVALVTTFWGLLVAIPALTVFHIMRNRIDGLLAECAVQAEEMISVFRPLGRGSLVVGKDNPARQAAAPASQGKAGQPQRANA